MAGGRGGSMAAAATAAFWLLLAACSTLAKTPGTTYCYIGVCHRVLTLEETAAAIGIPDVLVASHYDAPWRDPFNRSMITSSGELFRPEADDTAASPIYPDGTRLLVWEPTGGAALVIRINNAGPYYSNRLLDLSRGAAERLGLASRGVGRVEVMVLSAPRPREARYVAGRVYASVPGFIGRFDSLAKAHDGWREMAGGEPDEAPVVRTALALPDSAAERRVVIIPGRPGAGRAVRRGRGRVTLLPVAQRRPMLLRVLAVRRGAISRQARR